MDKPNPSTYMFGMADDRERLALLHEYYKPSFMEAVLRVLDEYGLAMKLAQAAAIALKTNNAIRATKIRILDVGCGEGLYLHDIAALLEKRGLLEGADFYGFDIDAKAIASASEFCKESNPPRPYFNFYLYDAQLPLANCEGLRLDIGEPIEFDFIFVSSVLYHIPDAQKVLRQLWGNLKAGGLIYVRNMICTVGEGGVVLPHPAMLKLYEPGLAYLRRLNGGIDVASSVAMWIHDLDATEVQETQVVTPLGGSGEAGLMLLRDVLSIIRNSAPMMVASKVISQQTFDEVMATLFQELGPHLQGYRTLVDVLAAKKE
jgi:SAM-dependent methyltransferase